MSVAAPPLPPDRSGTPGLPPGPYRLTVEQYERMGSAGILDEDDRVELLDGVLVSKMTKNEPHSFACTVAREALARLVTAGWYLRVEQPVRIPVHDEPEPDLAIVRGSPRDHLRLGRPPEPPEIGLVLEVADSTLGRDRSEKLRAYARGRVPFYWIVNLVDRQLEIYTDPEGERYGAVDILRAGQAAMVVLDGTPLGPVEVADLLP